MPGIFRFLPFQLFAARSDNLRSFEKVEGWVIPPPASLGQKHDFRDPQAYYDPESGIITMTITASREGVAGILKYSVAQDLSSSSYDGVIFTNREGSFRNLECTDLFRLGDTWYVTDSAQDDTL